MNSMYFSQSPESESKTILAEAILEYVERLNYHATNSSNIHPTLYKGSRSFELEDADMFFGRETAVQEFYRQILGGRLAILFGRHRVGKTSLLRAGLFPRLLSDGRLPVYIRSLGGNSTQDIIHSILLQLHLDNYPANTALHTFLYHICKHFNDGIRELVIILDQFERFFSLYLNDKERQSFASDIGDCLYDRFLPVRFIIALNADSFADLASFRPYIPNIFENVYPLNPMTREEMRSAITLPVAKLNPLVTYEQTLIDTLLDDLSFDEAESEHLQIICSLLYETLPAHAGTLTLDSYEELGCARGILWEYWKHILNYQLPRNMKSNAEVILKELVLGIEEQYRLTYDEIAARVKSDTLDHTLNYLVDNRLLDREYTDTVKYFLPHKYLTEMIKTWIDPSILNEIQLAADNHTKVLDLSNRGLTNLPAEIGQCGDLRVLRLNSNYLRTLPSEIGQLTALENLDLGDNLLTALPRKLLQLSKLQNLDISNNQLPIPDEIIRASETESDIPQAYVILNYYFRLQKEKRPLNEAKVILVGQGGVGKTSLVKRLVEGAFNPEQTKTDGVSVKKWVLPFSNDEYVYLNLWDFGGQEVMHATHQLFFTHRSLYLLVLDARKGEQRSDLEYWLQIIQSFGGNSPIIVVINKIDENPLELNYQGLRTKYPTICGFVETSCKLGAGIEDLRRHIIRELEGMKHIRSEWIESWFQVKTRLEQMESDYIEHSNYIDICRDAGVSDSKDQQYLLAFLHDLGVVLSYHNDPRLKETNILNPEWVTNAIYKILNDHELVQTHGLLSRHHLDLILDPHRYPHQKHDFILGMMRKFELCFPTDDEYEERYLLPDLLSKQEPVFDWLDLDACLNFHYHYGILPGSVISRLIVRMYACIDNRQVWRTGVLLHYPNHGNQALVKADLEARRVTISVYGNRSTRREFLAIIRSHFEHIHSTIAGLNVTEVVPIPGYQSVFEEYGYLLMLERNGEESFYPRGGEQRVLIQPLLDGIESPTVRGVTGLPPALVNRLQRILLATHCFDDQDKLQDLFIDSRIAPWADVVPTRGDARSRAQALINLLKSSQHAHDGEYALALFIQVVRDHLDPGDMLHSELQKLSEEVQRVLREMV